jgi:hypothetical protein
MHVSPSLRPTLSEVASTSMYAAHARALTQESIHRSRSTTSHCAENPPPPHM